MFEVLMSPRIFKDVPPSSLVEIYLPIREDAIFIFWQAKLISR
jgi:hypothetical protein